MYEYPNGDISNGKVLLFFYAGYHSNCNITLQMLDDISKYHPDINLIKINTTKFYTMKTKYNIKVLPCIIYLKDGNVIDKISGSITFNLIEKLIKRNV